MRIRGRTDKDRPSKAGRVGLAGALVSAAAASACCIGPLLLLGLGVGGAWVSRLTVLEAYRPFFAAAALVFLGLGFYRTYRTPGKASCAADGACASPVSRRINKIALWTVTLLVAGLLLFPYAASVVLR